MCTITIDINLGKHVKLHIVVGGKVLDFRVGSWFLGSKLLKVKEIK